MYSKEFKIPSKVFNVFIKNNSKSITDSEKEIALCSHCAALTIQYTKWRKI